MTRVHLNNRLYDRNGSNRIRHYFCLVLNNRALRKCLSFPPTELRFPFIQHFIHPPHPHHPHHPTPHPPPPQPPFPPLPKGRPGMSAWCTTSVWNLRMPFDSSFRSLLLIFYLVPWHFLSCHVSATGTFCWPHSPDIALCGWLGSKHQLTNKSWAPPSPPPPPPHPTLRARKKSSKYLAKRELFFLGFFLSSCEMIVGAACRHMTLVCHRAF